MVLVWFISSGYLIFYPLFQFLSIPALAASFLGSLGYIFLNRKYSLSLSFPKLAYLALLIMLAFFVALNATQHGIIQYFKFFSFFTGILLAIIILLNRKDQISPKSPLLSPLIFYFFILMLLNIFLFQGSQRGFFLFDTSSINGLAAATFSLSIICYVYKRYGLFSFLIMIGVLMLVYTQSRTGLIQLTALLLYLYFNQKRRINLKVFLLVIIFFALSFVLLEDTLNRFINLSDGGFERQIRFLNLLSFYSDFERDPLFGSGLFSQIRPRYDAHNYLLEAFLQGGIFVGLIFLLVLLMTIKIIFSNSTGIFSFFLKTLIFLEIVGGMFSGSFLLGTELFILISIALTVNEENISTK